MKIAIIDLLGLPYNGDTLKERGLGGSESAVILMSHELSKLGFSVTVFNNCDVPAHYQGVRYVSHNQPIPDNQFDIVISSRSVFPFFSGNRYVELCNNAKHKVLWMHDTFCQGDEHLENMLVQGFIDEVFTLSDFHTNYVANAYHGHRRMFETMKNKIWVTRNGAVKYLDYVDLKKKDKNHFVFNANVTKGLRPLLDMIWPQIKNKLPLARLTVIGGFYHGISNEETMDESERILREYIKQEPAGVTFTGIIRQDEIAEILANAYMMLYPVELPETFGISTIESLLYKTPLVTNRFGALEETALEGACYKINYPTMPNKLYKNINAPAQANLFVDTVFKAWADPYLHQQKQEYCSIINEISGWDSVALQWLQHFYHVFNIPLPVDIFESVDTINNKVERIFGRRYQNKETIQRYPSNGKQRRILIISPFWNAENYIEQCIRSVASQSYEKYLHILIDDCSTDNSYLVAKNTIESLSSELQKKFVLIRNPNNVGAVANQINTIKNFSNSSDLVMLLDGDDWLAPNNTIFHYYNNRYYEGYDFMYGSCWSAADNIPLVAQDYPPDIIKSGSYRDYTFTWGIPYTHLRVFRRYLLDHINEDALKVDGEFMRAGADNPFFYELIQLAEKPLAVKEIMAIYNDTNPLNDYKVRAEEQKRNSSLKVADFKKVEKIAINQNKKILIAVPMSKYIEPETVKAIFDLEIPHGYEIEFQYFYGYQIDQVRNLIAEWGKKYDYLFCVDADIVMPKNTLMRMINSRKDVISGLYIQRIEDTHTLELYKFIDGVPGFHNIPYPEIKDKGITEVAACGFGCVLINSDVLRTMTYPHFVYKSALDHRHTFSEDIFFCAKAKEAGYKIYADPGIVCDHVGKKVFKV